MNVVKPDFKNPIKLYTDEKNREYKIGNSKLNIDKANQTFGYVENLFVKSPGHNKIFNAIKNGFEGIDDLVKETYGFANGEVETILRLHGRLENYIEAKSFIENSIFSFINYHKSEYIFNNGAFTFNPATVEEIKENCTIYTKNDKQNKAINVLNKIAEGLNEAFDNGIIYYDADPRSFDADTKNYVVRKMTKLLTVDNDRVVPDMVAISWLK